MEARCQVKIAQEYADYEDFVRGPAVWERYQEARAWLLGRWLVGMFLKTAAKRRLVQDLLRDGDALAAELWCDDELMADGVLKVDGMADCSEMMAAVEAAYGDAAIIDGDLPEALEPAVPDAV